MKSFLFLLATLFVMTVLTAEKAAAQSGLEGGIRFGDVVAADLTMPLAKEPRLHGAFYFDRIGIGTYFDWLFRLSNGPGNLRFYPGVGPEVFFEHQFDIRVAGNFGVEWAFSEVPITIGFDWRPAVRLTNGSDFNSNNWGFIARFRFGKSKFEPA